MGLACGKSELGATSLEAGTTLPHTPALWGLVCVVCGCFGAQSGPRNVEPLVLWGLVCVVCGCFGAQSGPRNVEPLVLWGLVCVVCGCFGAQSGPRNATRVLRLSTPTQSGAAP
ncbi:hypothetical protein GCM10017707_14730 [Paenarthrobacter aurescens]